MLTQTLLKTGLRDLLRRPWQSGLMVLGVALGVAVVIAVDLANGSARRGFELSTEAVVGRATHQIRGGPEGLPDDLYRQLRVAWGFRGSAPVVEGLAIAPALDSQPLRLLGVDPMAEGPFRDYLALGSAPTPDYARFYTEPGAVLVPIALAERYGLGPGDRLSLQVNGRIESVRVLGTLDPGDENGRRALDGLLLMDVSTAQELLGQNGRLSRIDLIATPAEVERLNSLLPNGVRAVPASEQAEAIANLTSAFHLNLTALSMLALIVGMFLIHNTMMFSVLQRRAVLGTLRGLGVTGGQLFALIIVEAVAVSAVGVALGIGLGWALGQGAVRMVTQTINDLYYVTSVRDAPLTWLSGLKGLGLGIGAGALAAAVPALEAARVPPITAMRRSTLEDRVRVGLPWVALAGVGLAGLGAALLAAITSSLVAGFAGMLLIILGIALTVPGATVVLMRAALPLLSTTAGTLGRMAARTVVQALSRTGIAITALMVAVSVTLAVSLMISSFRDTVVNWLDLTVRADVYVSAPSVGGTGPAGSFETSVAERVAAVPGVETVETFRSVVVESEHGPARLSVLDARRERDRRLYRFAEGSPAEVWAQVQRGAVLVSEPFAYRHGLPPHGAALTLRTDRGERAFPVAAIVYDYSTDQGIVLMSRNVYEQYWDDRGVSSLGVFVAPGASPQAVADRLRQELSGTTLRVQVNRALREQALRVFDRTFAITNALRVLAVAVAFIGVLSALMALQLERARELATMQAVGLTPGQLNRLALLETGLMGAAAGVLSLPTGLLLSLVLIHVINLRSFGWTIQMRVEPAPFLQALGVSVLAALLAAIYPLYRQGQMPVAEGLRQE